MTERFDVAVIGAGVVGAAVARELALHELTVVMIDARSDVGAGTSKANTAILHTGFDATPGTLESSLVRRGYTLLAEHCAARGIAVERVGALLVAWDAEQLTTLDALATKAVANGYDGAYHVDVDELYRREPHLGPGAVGALAIPDESIIDPWTVPISLATEAVLAGCELRLDCRVERIIANSDGNGSDAVVVTARGDVRAGMVVNAAGLGADLLEATVGHHDFTVTPRRGQLIVFDKLARSLVNHIVLPVPSKMGKGVLVSPTVFGNVMVGPTAEDLDDRTATDTTTDGLVALVAKATRLVPALVDHEVTSTYAGLRAATEHGDYCISVDLAIPMVTLGGIRSTGLTAALAIAEHTRDLLHDAGMALGHRRADDPRPATNLGEAFPRRWERGDSPIVCHCEKVTRAEIDEACTATIGARDLDGLRRRTRAVTGRCQGNWCVAEVLRVMGEQ